MVFFRYFLSAFSIIFGIILLGMIFFCTKELKITGIFLRLAGMFVRSRPIAYVVIGVFLVLLIALVTLFIFQFLAFFSLGNMGYDIQSPFY
jgi:hypothetical protein